MPTTTVRGIDLILVGSLGKETLSNDSFENLALGISGTTTIALTATDYTLTTDNQGEAMRMILVLTGTLTANVTVFVPAEGRVFVVDNRTTGAFTVTFTTATGTGFAVPQAERTFLYCDGTDVFPVGTGGGGGGGAPPDAPYLVSSAHSLLTGERVVTDTATVLWDHTTVGQSRATVPAASETAAGVLELATAAETQAGTDTTRAVTPAGLAAKVPSGTALSVVRYAAGGQALEETPGLTTTSDGRLGVGVTPDTGKALQVLGATRLHVSGINTNAIAVVQEMVHQTSADMVDGFGPGASYAIQDNTVGPLQIGDMGFGRHGDDSSGRLRIRAWKTGSGSNGGFLYLDPDGNLTLGNTQPGTGASRTLTLRSGTAPTTSPADAVQIWSADQLAGQASLYVRTENGTSHVLGNAVGINTLCAETLGSGEAYRRLNVSGPQLFVGQSSVQERPQALLIPSWVVSTDASRTARLSLSAYDATAAREGLRLEADGSAARLGFYGGSAVAKPTVTGSRGGNAALASLLTALSSLGLVTDSSTA